MREPRYADLKRRRPAGPALPLPQSIEEFIVSDSIPLDPKKKGSVFTVLSVASLLGEAIKRIHQEQSVSSLFN